MKKVCCRLEDGAIAIVEPSPNYVAELVRSGMTVDQAITAIGTRDAPKKTTSSFLVDQTPSDRTFREAWEASGNSVDVNMEKARSIHMGRIRSARNDELDRIDREETARAITSGDQPALTAIETRKKALRDLPVSINLEKYNTARGLAAYWPKELKA